MEVVHDIYHNNQHFEENDVTNIEKTDTNTNGVIIKYEPSDEVTVYKPYKIITIKKKTLIETPEKHHILRMFK